LDSEEDEDENERTEIVHENKTTEKRTTLKLYKHQLNALLSLRARQTENPTDAKQEIADMLIRAHLGKQRSGQGKFKQKHLAADPPVALLNWISAFTKTERQHMASPLSLHPEIFSEPPTLMPGSTSEEQRGNWIAQEERTPENWDTILWEKHGVFAMTSGAPNTKPDPSAQTLAQDAIRKATVSAHRGITTIFLLELQANLDLFPKAQNDNSTNAQVSYNTRRKTSTVERML
jgi:hypothetical protein